MNLLELLHRHRALFYSQFWYKDEAFLRTLPTERFHRPPSRVVRVGQVPTADDDLPFAVDVANGYIRYPDDPMYSGWLWCRDTDHDGQRIFVGGTANGQGFQLHRHLDINDTWGTPTWL